MTDKQIKNTTLPGDFIFHQQWFEIFRSFTPEQAGRLLHAMIDYLTSGLLPDDRDMRLLCTFLFAHLDVDREHILSLQPKSRRKTTKPDPEPPIPAPDHSSSSSETQPEKVPDTPPSDSAAAGNPAAMSAIGSIISAIAASAANKTETRQTVPAGETATADQVPLRPLQSSSGFIPLRL